MAEKTYTGTSLEHALKDNSLTRAGIVLVGMVKASEKGGYIRFTRAGCENWVDLPVDLIECAELLGHQACKDHSHPLMKITLKEPKDPAAQILAALLAQPPTGGGGPMPAQGGPGYGSQGYPTNPMGGGYGGPHMTIRRGGGGAGGAGYPTARSSARLGGGFGFPGGGGGGLNAWGCWSSCCGSHCAAGHYEEGPIGTVWVCDWWVCDDPCERCIWPW
jgi:hypothetical protein